MTPRFTISQVDSLLKKGKIRAYILTKSAKKKESPAIPKPSKEKAWIAWNLKIWCEEKGVDLKTEYRFHQERMFRFDHAIPVLLIAIEYEGLMSEKNGHTTPAGYTKDTTKYNLAQAHGWRVIRLTALNYKTLLTELNNLLKRK